MGSRLDGHDPIAVRRLGRHRRAPSWPSHVRPRSLRQGTLVVAVSDPAWATQLRFLEAELVARIRTTTASSEVTAIQVRVVPGTR